VKKVRKRAKLDREKSSFVLRRKLGKGKSPGKPCPKWLAFKGFGIKFVEKLFDSVIEGDSGRVLCILGLVVRREKTRSARKNDHLCGGGK